MCLFCVQIEDDADFHQAILSSVGLIVRFIFLRVNIAHLYYLRGHIYKMSAR